MEQQQWICPNCSKAILPDDTFVLDSAGCPTWTANGPVLSPEERVVLFRFCSEHAVAECEQCAKSYYRMTELASDLSAAESTSARAAAQI
jgi:hypothetical protein